MVVMGDLALYAKGPARPTGGAGAIGLLVGPNAPLVFERNLRSVHMTHAYDFYKPVMDSEYPIVDGQLSVICYLDALDICYQRYKSKYHQQHEQQQQQQGNQRNIISNNNHTSHMANGENNKEGKFTLASADAFLFHSPYCKLVQKSLARLYWNDYLDNDNDDETDHDKQKDGLNGANSFDKFK